MTSSDIEIKIRIVTKLARNNSFGTRCSNLNDAVNWVRTSDQGRAKELIDEMIANDDEPLRRGRGPSANRPKVGLTSPGAAVEFLERHDARIPFSLEPYRE